MPDDPNELRPGDLVETTLSTSDPNVGYVHSPRLVLVTATSNCRDVLRGRVFPLGQSDILLHVNRSTLVWRE